jgi:hypothetical protein
VIAFSSVQFRAALFRCFRFVQGKFGPNFALLWCTGLAKFEIWIEVRMELLLTAIGAFLGAFLSILASIAIEYQRKPKLHLAIESPTWQNTFPGDIKSGTFARVYLSNESMPQPLRWLGRSAAYQCAGHVQFHHLDGAPIFAKPMPIRWARSDEPISYQRLPDDSISQLFDPAKYNAAFRRDCFPGTSELIDIAARFDNDEDCFGWSNDSYVKGWRNAEYRLPKGRYLVTVTVYSSGDRVEDVFELENSVAREHFRLLPTSRARA